MISNLKHHKFFLM